MATTFSFDDYLKGVGLAPNSVLAYTKAVELYQSMFSDFSPESLDKFRTHLICRYKPQTTNQRLLALNKYLRYLGHDNLRLRPIKIQTRTFTENIISLEDYLRFKDGLLRDNDLHWYFMVWIMGATGARVSELMQIRVEDVVSGWCDVLSKGGKIRRIFFPQRLRLEMIEWGMNGGLTSGHVYRNSKGNVITPRGFAMQLKAKAKHYNIDPKVVFPHSFRHMFAITFLKHHPDIALLADLLGHDSLETTQIYLRQSTRLQLKLIDSVVFW